MLLGEDFMVVEVTIVTARESCLFDDQGIFDIFTAYKLSSLAPLTCRTRAVALLGLSVTFWLFALIVGALVRANGAVSLEVTVNRLIKNEFVKFLMACVLNSAVGSSA
jgi:hypothetical protein